MKKLITLSFIMSPLISLAVTKYWTGAAGDNKWSSGINWTGSLQPAQGDDIIFNTSDSVYIDVVLPSGSSSFNSLTITNGQTITIASSAIRTIELYNLSGPYALKLEQASVLNLSGNFQLRINIQAGNSSIALIDGTLNCKAPLSQLQAGSGILAPVLNCNGTIKLFSGSGNITGFLSTNTFFNNGSVLELAKDGGALPAGTHANGSTLKVTGVVNTGPSFNSSSNYQGLIEWNSPLQTVNGANILPTTSFKNIDSIRIVSTGAGSARLNTNPSSFIVGHIELQGGTLAIGSPGSAVTADTISTDLKITGGTLIGNMTTAGELSAYPVTLVVKGNVSISGTGTLNFTNRPIALSPGGAFVLNAKGNFSQTAGAIGTTFSYATQNQLLMNGTIPQNLGITSMTGDVALVIANTTGVSLQSNMVLPYTLNLLSGYLQLNNFNTTLTASLLSQASNVYPVPKVVTNGTGLLKLNSLTGPITVPVSPASTSYNPLYINNGQGSAYSFKVDAGISPSIVDGQRAINRTWHILPSPNPVGNVQIGFQYTGSADKNASCNPADPMEVGERYDDVAWAVIAVPLSPVLPGGADTFKVATASTNLFRNDGLATRFVVANVNAILPSGSIPELMYSRQAEKEMVTLFWNTEPDQQFNHFIIESSDDARRFTAIKSINATASITHYSFADTRLMAPVTYFRLKVTDAGGKVSYSKTIGIRSANSAALIVSASPTITQGILNVNLDAANASEATLIVSDITGKKLITRSISVVAGTSNMLLDVSKFAAGVYQLNLISNGTASRLVRFVKE